MEEVAARPEKILTSKKGDATRKQIRGSSLLLAGRFIATGLNFVSQVLIVRQLSQTDFGAWAYALSIVAFFHGISTLGLRRGITRFVPIYHERDEYDKLFGSIALTILTIAVTTVVIIGGMYLDPEMLTSLINDKEGPMNVVLILIFLVPMEATDDLLVALFASFASPKAIFFRKHILGPALKVVVVALLIAFDSDVLFLAYGWLAVNAAGILLYVGMLIKMMRDRDLFQHFSFKNLDLPIKEIFAFTIPLMTSDLVNIVMHSMDTLMLGYFQDVTEVAKYRVILPAAQFNKIVMMSFALLYTPLGARLFAKKDYNSINDLYWKTAVWMSILSFPVFAVTFSLAKPVTLFLYGARYESSWLLLAITSFGYYFNVVLGFNGLTLKVLGHLRYVVIINLAAAIINAALVFFLIPRYGALGAAVGTMLAMVIHNILKQVGLKRAAGMHLFEWQYLSFYIIITAGSVGLLIVQYVLDVNIYISVAAAAIVSAAILLICRDKLNVQETFPELLKLPFMAYLLNVKDKNVVVKNDENGTAE